MNELLHSALKKFTMIQVAIQRLGVGINIKDLEGQLGSAIEDLINGMQTGMETTTAEKPPFVLDGRHEVWLRSIEVAVRVGSSTPLIYADTCLKEFDKRFVLNREKSNDA